MDDMNPPPPGLTFGVELEFIVQCRVSDYFPTIDLDNTNRRPNLRTAVGEHIVAVLRKAGFDMYDLYGPIPREYERWTLTLDGSIATPPPGEWCGPDPAPVPVPAAAAAAAASYTSAEERQKSSKAWGSAALELISPILLYDSPDWRDTIPRLLGTLHAAFPPGSIYCNWSTGVHVHVGRGARGFKPQTLVNLAQTCLAFERQLDGLHPPHRLHSPWATRLSTLEPFRQLVGRTFEQCLVIERCCNAAAAAAAAATAAHRKDMADTGLDAFDRDHHVSRTDDQEEGRVMNELIELLNPHGKDHAYAFRELRYNPHHECVGQAPCPHRLRKRTIEFRQHEGTMDSGRIMAWVDVCAGLVLWAETAKHVPHLQAMMVSQFRRPDEFGILELLRLIGRDSLTGFYADRVWDHQSGGGPEVPPSPSSSSSSSSSTAAGDSAR
ncbi:MAG: hypothetical protein M1837_006618 [Sclerophora amabilis]|nr:MAG: hypothetical protein M1837_006618 [Sclerophora amabilis]